MRRRRTAPPPLRDGRNVLLYNWRGLTAADNRGVAVAVEQGPFGCRMGRVTCVNDDVPEPHNEAIAPRAKQRHSQCLGRETNPLRRWDPHAATSVERRSGSGVAGDAGTDPRRRKVPPAAWNGPRAARSKPIAIAVRGSAPDATGCNAMQPGATGCCGHPQARRQTNPPAEMAGASRNSGIHLRCIRAARVSGNAGTVRKRGSAPWSRSWCSRAGVARIPALRWKSQLP
jgi:hypothetical protein